MIWAGGRRNTRCRTRNPWLLSQSQTHPVSPRKKMRRKRMMMMMATSPSMISGEILTRTRRMGKRIRSQVMGTKLKRKVPRFLKRREQDQGPRTLLRNVRGDHGHRALRGLGLDRERSESQEKGAQEALQAHLQVGPGLGAEGRTRRSQDPDLGRGRREEDRPLAVGPEVAQNDRGERDGQGAPSRAPRNELEPELRIKSWARAPMQIHVVFSFEINSLFKK